MGKGKKSNKKSGRKSGRSAQLANTSTAYRGPIRPWGSTNAAQVVLTRLTQMIVVAADASGLIISSANNNPAGAIDFTDFSGLYAEYRVLAFKVTYVPWDVGFSGNPVPPVQRPLVTWIERDPVASSPLNYAGAWDNDGAIVRNCGRQFSVTIRMNGTPDADWKLCSAPSATQSMGMFGNGTISTTYGQMFIEYLTQFRSRL